jgi:CHAD domain-containing protein
VPPRLPSDLLNRSAQEASRLLSLSYLDQIDSAHARLGNPEDQAALHDFRVGIRRLRSAVRAYRPELRDSIGGKMRRRLRSLARATNQSRDLEVQLDWLEKQRVLLGPEEVPGFYWLVGRLEDQKQETHHRAVTEVARRYQKAAARLRRSLGVLRIELQTGSVERLDDFRRVTGGLVHRTVAELRDQLSQTQDAGDAGQAHRTRIAFKRLRYLLEPVARRNRRAGALIRRLKEAQDLLGEHHDMHLLSGAIASLRRPVSTGKFPGVEPGLATLARLAQQAADSAFDRFHSVWGGDHGSRILARTEELGRQLESSPEPEAPQASEPVHDSAKALTRRHEGEQQEHEGQSRSRHELLVQQHTTEAQLMPSAEEPNSTGVLLTKNIS